ncbi:hypothetical protein ACHMWU_24795 [Aeromicrobium sp. UC242_57]
MPEPKTSPATLKAAPTTLVSTLILENSAGLAGSVGGAAWAATVPRTSAVLLPMIMAASAGERRVTLILFLGGAPQRR